MSASSNQWDQGYDRLAKGMVRLISTDQPGRLGEIGSGRGQLTGFLQKYCSEMVLGLDILDHGFRGPFVRGDARRLPLKRKVLSNVISNFSVGWFDALDLDTLFMEIRRVLRPGGHFIISDYVTTPENPAQQLVLEQGLPENNLDPSPRWWKPAELELLLKRSGLKPIGHELFDWRIHFEGSEAAMQLRNWGTKEEFIRSNEEVLREWGLELPKSFILVARLSMEDR